MSRESRSDKRRSFTHVVRIQLLEDDMDQAEFSVEGLRGELTAMRKLLVGILVSVTTASILLVVNVIVIGRG